MNAFGVGHIGFIEQVPDIFGLGQQEALASFTDLNTKKIFKVAK